MEGVPMEQGGETTNTSENMSVLFVELSACRPLLRLGCSSEQDGELGACMAFLTCQEGKQSGIQ